MNGPFSTILSKIQEDIWILANNPWLLVCSHLTTRWGGTPSELPRRRYFIRWLARVFHCLEPPPTQPHFPTEHHRVKSQGGEAEARRRRRRGEESGVTRSEEVNRPQSVMCSPVIPTRTKPAQTRYSIPQIQHSSDTAKVWQQKCPPDGCGRIRTDVSRPGYGRVGDTVQNKQVTREGKKHLNSFPTFLYLFLSLFVL